MNSIKIKDFIVYVLIIAGLVFCCIETCSHKDCQISYTSDIKISLSGEFDENIKSHTFENGVGIIKFREPITAIGKFTWELNSIPNEVLVKPMHCAFRIPRRIETPPTIPRIRMPKTTNVSAYTNHKFVSFKGCTSLTSITIPESVIVIGDNAFDGCSNLTNVTIPNSVEKIGSEAFSGCISLTNITIPNSVEEIGSKAFSSCRSLTSITIPNSVKKIDHGAFDDCTSLPIRDGIRYADTYLVEVVDKTRSSYSIKPNTRFIGPFAFKDCTSLTSITVPESVTKISNEAFRYCSALKEFNGKFASSDNRCLIIDGKLIAVASAGLTQYIIPNSVTEIGYDVFLSSSKLTSITIPESVTNIEILAFRSCSKLKEFNGKFASSDNRCLIIGGKLIAVAPAGLTKYTIPNSVTMIAHFAFYDCHSLTSVTIPDSVTSIGMDAFCNCDGLTNITIPNSVTSIGMCAFQGCRSLTSVYCKATTPPTGGPYMFSFQASGRKIYVPRNSVEAYKSAEGWKEYANNIVGYDF